MRVDYQAARNTRGAHCCLLHHPCMLYDNSHTPFFPMPASVCLCGCLWLTCRHEPACLPPPRDLVYGQWALGELYFCTKALTVSPSCLVSCCVHTCARCSFALVAVCLVLFPSVLMFWMLVLWEAFKCKVNAGGCMVCARSTAATVGRVTALPVVCCLCAACSLRSDMCCPAVLPSRAVQLC